MGQIAYSKLGPLFIMWDQESGIKKDNIPLSVILLRLVCPTLNHYDQDLLERIYDPFRSSAKQEGSRARTLLRKGPKDNFASARDMSTNENVTQPRVMD